MSFSRLHHESLTSLADKVGLKFCQIGQFTGSNILVLKWKSKAWIELDVPVGTDIFTGSLANGMNVENSSY